MPRGPRTISPSPLRSLPRPGPCSPAPFVWNSVYHLFYSLFQLLVSCVVFTSASSNRQAGAHGGLLGVVPGAEACSCTPGRQEAPTCPSSARWQARLKWSPWGGLRCGACWERPPWAQRAMRSSGGAAHPPTFSSSPRPTFSSSPRLPSGLGTWRPGQLCCPSGAFWPLSLALRGAGVSLGSGSALLSLRGRCWNMRRGLCEFGVFRAG